MTYSIDFVFLQIAFTDMPGPTWRAEQQLFSHLYDLTGITIWPPPSHQEKRVIFSFALFIIFIHQMISYKNEPSARGCQNNSLLTVGSITPSYL